VTTSNLYELAREKWLLGARRDAIGRDLVLWLCDTQSPTQVGMWAGEDGLLSVDTPDCFCWIRPTGQGLIVDGEPTDEPVPNSVAELLSRSLPYPRERSVYGYVRDDRVVALSYVWERDGELNATLSVLDGEPGPELERSASPDHRYLDPVAWWDAVDAGSIITVDQQVGASAEPIEMRRVNGVYSYILVRAERGEPWTGVHGPALYVCASSPPLTLEQALAAEGHDIRGRFRAGVSR
jgi:hypothetical protein